MKVKRIRSITKALTFRIMATTVTILLVLIFTGNLYISIGVGSLEFVLKAVLYYLHERAWNRTNFGRID